MKTIACAIILTAMWLSGCDNECAQKFRHYASQTNYDIDPNQTTDGGIEVDDDVGIDIRTIDRLTKEAEDCLSENFGENHEIPYEVQYDGECWKKTFSLPISRSCLTVKIPDDWFLSHDGTQQVLPAEAPLWVCQQKGQDPPPHGCHWRVAIQDYTVIVATPSLYLYKDALIRLATGCNNPWGHDLLAECATPTTPPL